jgi:starch phosphorylase
VPSRHIIPLPNTIAYFSMEIGLDPNIPTYSGGLGILAGDTIRAAADVNLPYVGITLLTRQGYFLQCLDSDGTQHATPQPWDVRKQLKLCQPQVSVHLDQRHVKVRAWRYTVTGVQGTAVPVIYLDTDMAGNHRDDRALSQALYGGDNAYRLRQEWILGIAGVKMLRALGYKQVKCFHMNEGHAAFLTFELLSETLRASRDKRLTKAHLATVQQQCVFTTHTPVPAGHDAFAIKDAKQAIGPHPAWAIARSLGVKKGILNMTHLALSLSRYVNGVAQKHGEVSREMFPDHTIDAITNGVHVASWTAPPIHTLLDRHVPGWRQDTERLRYALAIPLTALDRAHQTCKEKLVKQVNRNSPVRFDPHVFTIGFGRRATAYKRADLILQRPAQLKRLVETYGKIQIIFAGKAHPQDRDGQQLIRNITRVAQDLAGVLPIVYLPNYDMSLARVLIPGVDLWLNNPEPPLEASGTSGMKAAINGIPSLSILDGWWIEGCVEGVTGWAIDSLAGKNYTARHRASLYRKLGKILTLYYQHPQDYLQVMRNALALNGAYFNTRRMVLEYVRKAYRV